MEGKTSDLRASCWDKEKSKQIETVTNKDHFGGIKGHKRFFQGEKKKAGGIGQEN